MTPDERNQIIHEAMGKCWHIRNRTIEEQCVAHAMWRKVDTSAPYPHLECRKCEKILDLNMPDNPDYSEWQHYGPLLEWAIEQEWKVDFLYFAWERELSDKNTIEFSPFKGTEYFFIRYGLPTALLDCEEGSTAIAEFLKERK